MEGLLAYNSDTVSVIISLRVWAGGGYIDHWLSGDLSKIPTQPINFLVKFS